MDYPKITIITPSFNQGQFLEETILSVIEQGYPNLEYLVIDGGSTDNSVEIIRKYASNITWWISEKDKGQTDAINKGLKRATGDIINWINSDDLLAKGSLHHVAEKFLTTNALCLCGPITMFRVEKQWEFPSAFAEGETLKSVFGRDSFNQPGTFFHRDAILKMGFPDQRLNYVMDKEWFMRYLLLFGTGQIVVTNQSLAFYRFHDLAKTVADAKEFFDEYAALVYRIAEQTGEAELQQLIAAKYDCIQHVYRLPIELPEANSEMAHQMTSLLLLRRFNVIYTKTDFDFARKLDKIIRWSVVELDADLSMKLKKMRSAIRSNNWTMFRILRKLGIAGQ